MSIARRAIRLILLAALAIAIIIISAGAANELAGGIATNSRLYSFMHRVPYEQGGQGTEYEIGRLYIVHHTRLMRPLDSIRFAVGWEDEPTTLVRSGRPIGDPTATITSMLDSHHPAIPPDIRTAWAASISGMVRAVLLDGPDAALAAVNRDRDGSTFSYPLPESGIPIPEEIFRQGHSVIYPPGLRVGGGNPFGFLIVWALTAVVLTAIAKVIADAIRRGPLKNEVSQ